MKNNPKEWKQSLCKRLVYHCYVSGWLQTICKYVKRKDSMSSDDRLKAQIDVMLKHYRSGGAGDREMELLCALKGLCGGG